jgi:hypothetical protein
LNQAPRRVPVDDRVEKLFGEDHFIVAEGDDAQVPVDPHPRLGQEIRRVLLERVSDFEVARRVFRSLAFLHNVLYIQEFVPHGTRDMRAFVVGDRVVAAMYRVAEGWRTNVSQGAKTVAFEPTSELEQLAVKASKILGCEISGVDIMEGPKGYVINKPHVIKKISCNY